MRRPLAVAALAVALAARRPAARAPARVRAPPRGAASPPEAQQALATVQRLLGDRIPLARRAAPGRPEVTLAMRDLFAALPKLDAGRPASRRSGYLARPTDGTSDPLGDGYRCPRRRSAAATSASTG